jgi:release factor glutamine methyltransferase
MAQTEEVWTVGRLLAWTTDFLRGRGAESPRLDAEVLLAHALGCPRIQLYTTFDDQPPEAARQKFREFVRQRAGGMPVAYLVGRREFYSLSFRVTPEVLIPRPETEFLLIRLLDLAKQRGATSSEPLRIADVGTGSGILAICAAKNLAKSTITAIDLSPAALGVARENAEEHKVAERIEFVESDLFAEVPADEKFDFIVSNPPYVTTAEMEELMVDVRKFEPRMALDGGQRGTDVIERLIPQIAERLVPGGWLLMEIGPAIEADVRRLVNEQGKFELSPTIKDLAGHARVIQARRS